MWSGNRKRILILGGGFAGVYCARKLEKLVRQKKIDAQISLVSRDNYMVFTPMLPQVVSGMIETNHVVVPIRQILKHTEFYEATVESIDVRAKKIGLSLESDEQANRVSPEDRVIERQTLLYDQLVISLGADTNFMHMPHLEDVVFTLKNLKDAVILRNHVIDMLERADIEPDVEKRRLLLNFVIVGGGLSGVETAGELNSFLREAAKYYPRIFERSNQDSPISVTVVQSRERILPELAPALAVFTLRQLREEGVIVKLNCKVVDATKTSVTLLEKDGQEHVIPAKTVIWTAGISPNPVIGDVPVEKPSSGRLPVDKHLRVNGFDDVWAIGDSAYIIEDASGNPYPATAQHAVREARIVANNIVNTLALNKLEEFDYCMNAQMASIGRRSAIVRIAGINIRGFLAWWLWRMIYLQKLPMLKKRLRVIFDWTIDIFFDRDLTHIRGFKESKVVRKDALSS
jgi:NADH dehydrogenase